MRFKGNIKIEKRVYRNVTELVLKLLPLDAHPIAGYHFEGVEACNAIKGRLGVRH